MRAAALEVTGIVQGVGFRPFVYTLALECGLMGYVRNDARGVHIVVEGKAGAVDTFCSRLEAELPPLARIDRLQVEAVAAEGFETFEIRQSDTAAGGRSAVVSPDMAVCEKCAAEMDDPADRRAGYWLINCTDCGPRYSITRTVPYDRPNTSMDVFEMCDACRSEYENPYDRRYHAQPISCPDCGPKTYYHQEGVSSEGEQAFMAAVEALKVGQIVAVKGLGGFHLMCDATDEAAVRRLRERKHRPSKPFAVMFPNLEAVHVTARVSEAEAKLIASRQKPIVLVRSERGEIAPSVAPGIDRLGVFLPYTPLHLRLFEAIDVPLVATSANLSDEPILREAEALNEKLAGIFDGVLTHEREIINACDDSVMQVVDGRPLVLRLARGYAPLTLPLERPTDRKILAVGANQKNTMALAFDDRIVVTPHIGDLGSIEAFEYFERTLETFKGFYGFEPDLIVCDKHPGYETTKWAKLQGVEVAEVQHHVAHMLAGMAEYGLDEEVLAITFDGTGYGNDGTIWGGEVFLGDVRQYERVFTLKPFRLLGGEKAVREPRRAALGLLFECYGLEQVLEMELPTVNAFSEAEIRMLHAAWKRGLNAPQCSSMGRLFDAVASLAGLCQEVSYEGESGLLLEAAVGNAADLHYDLLLDGGVIDWSSMLEAVVSEGESHRIAGRFIATLAEVMVTLARRFDRPVLLGGGVFQNRTLLEAVTRRFEEEGIRWYLPSRFPVNDGAIALGQIWHALNR